MSWRCSCGLINSGLNTHCAAIQFTINESHKPVTSNGYDELTDIIARRDIYTLKRLLWELKTSMSDKNEELFIKYYNEHSIVVSDMDAPTLREHIQKLQQIVIVAKAQTQAAIDRGRKLEADANGKAREWMVPIDNENRVGSDAIRTVEKRKERMTKLEKLQESMKAFGLSDDAVKETINKVSKTATEEQVNSLNQFKPKSNGEVKETVDPDTNKTQNETPSSNQRSWNPFE